MSLVEQADRILTAKQVVIKEREAQQSDLEKQLQKINEDGTKIRSPGCSICRILFGARRNKLEVPSVGSSSTSKLASAQQQLRARCDKIASKAEEARELARSLHSTGKRTEALSALRRAKILEKQHQAAQTAAETLDSQVFALEEADLQQQVASALSSSVKKTKKATKGLLSKTEKAVDGSVEVRDAAEDVAAVLEGLRPAGGEFDEDELLEELQAMDDGGGGGPTAAQRTPVVDVLKYPRAPNNKIELKEENGTAGLLAVG